MQQIENQQKDDRFKPNLTKPLDLTAKIHKYRGDKTTLNDIMETELREPQIWKILLRQTT